MCHSALNNIQFNWHTPKTNKGLFKILMPSSYNILVALIFSMILHLSQTQITVSYEAINLTCVNASNILSYPNPTYTYISVSPYNYVNIQVDLRHLASLQSITNVTLILNINNTDTNSTYSQNLNLNNSVTSFGFYSANNMLISAVYSITDETAQLTQGKSYLFGQSVSMNITPANNYGQQLSFLFVVTSQDQINLPYNMISANNANNFDGYFITQQLSLDLMQSQPQALPSYSVYWSQLSQVNLPYLPYFSNCQNSGEYLYLQQMIHNESQCTLYGYNSTPINPLNFGSKAIADTCTIVRNCIYDEIPNSASQYPFWNTLAYSTSTNTYLFSITSDQFATGQIPSGLSSSAVLVSCTLDSSSEGSNSSNMYPLKVTIDIGYYQKTNEIRSIMSCAVQYSLYVASSANFSYQLQVSFAPLDHTKILLLFGFDWYIYVFVFMIIGLLSNIQFLIFWIYHLIITTKDKITFNIKIYFRLIKEIGKGAGFAFAIIIFLTFIIEIVMNGTYFGRDLPLSFESIWDFLIVNNIGYFASNNLISTRSGRMGFAQIVVSVYLMIRLSDSLIGKQRKKEEYAQYEIMGRRFKPQQWNRGGLLFGTFFMIALSLVYLYFAYTNLFNLNIWTFIVLVQILQMIIEEILFSLYEDEVPCMPLKLTLGVLSYLATMGAIDLYYFILGYLVDVLISTIQISYLSNLQEAITKFIERKIADVNTFYRKMLNDDQQQLQKVSKIQNNIFSNNEYIFIDNYVNQVQFLEIPLQEAHNHVDLASVKCHDKQTELKALFIQSMFDRNERHKVGQERSLMNNSFVKVEDEEEERLQLQSRKFQLILDCTINMLQYMIQPVIVFLLWITYSTSNIFASFNIALPNCILYFLSSVILAIFFQINIVLVFHVLQLYLNFDYKQPIRQILHRFAHKKVFWITDEDQFNSQLELRLRAASNYSMSSQLYFVVSLYTCCMYLFMMGFSTVVAANFNIFKDPYCLLLILFWIVVVELCTWIIKKIAYCFDIWGYRSLSQKQKVNQQQGSVSLPQADQQTQQIMLQESMTGSSIRFSFKRLSDGNRKAQNQIDIENERKKIAQDKLKTICKKLEPQFEQEHFRLDFSIKNKQFVRENIQKILPLIQSFPENDGFLLRKGSKHDQKDIKKSNKNCEPYISDFLASWLKRTETNRAKRVEDGIERERKLKKCNFCFNTWNIYYGYEGMCLDCSKKLFSKRAKNMKSD